MADCLLDLMLRPTESEPAPVQVTLDVLAPLGALLGGDAPCEIDGQVVPAAMVRALLTALTGHPLGTETTATAPADTAATDTTAVDAAAPDNTAPDNTAPDSPAPAGAGPGLSEDEDFALWAEQLQDRILAGDFDAEPPPDAPDENPPPPPPRPPASAVPDGWWARADAAVDAAVEDASTAVLTAQQALGHARRLVATAARAATTDETHRAAGPAGQVTAAPDALTALAAATDTARKTLTDLPALHRTATHGANLGPPGPTDGHRPGAALDRHVRARDRRCRFPGCRRPVPRGGELDHTIPWPAGPTTATNLTGYCTSHHRGKHQAPGWRHEQAPDGTLTVTTPTGLTATTTPPPY